MNAPARDQIKTGEPVVGTVRAKSPSRTRINTGDSGRTMDAQSSAPRLLTLREAAARLSVSYWTVRSWVESGVLIAVRLPGDGACCGSTSRTWTASSSAAASRRLRHQLFGDHQRRHRPPGKIHSRDGVLRLAPLRPKNLENTARAGSDALAARPFQKRPSAPVRLRARGSPFQRAVNPNPENERERSLRSVTHCTCAPDGRHKALLSPKRSTGVKRGAPDPTHP